MTVTLYLLLLCCIALVVSNVVASQPVEGHNFSAAAVEVQDWIDQGAFPGAVALVGHLSDGVLWQEAFGHFTYGIAPPHPGRVNPKMEVHATHFDLASLTKIFATTVATMKMVDQGLLSVDDKVVTFLGSEFNNNGKGNITVANLMLHNAGFSPDPVPNFWAPEFGCPNTSEKEPALDFSCQTKIYEALMAQVLVRPVGEKFVYSDLSMLTMMQVIGEIALKEGLVAKGDMKADCVAGAAGNSGVLRQCAFEGFVRQLHQGILHLNEMEFVPPASFESTSAPCENATFAYQGRVNQGQVSDGNAYAYGGIAGHAGLFSNGPDLASLIGAMGSGVFISERTLATFVKVHNPAQSSRGYGFDTNLNHDSSCGPWPEATYLHTGFTGTQFCVDPVSGYFSVLLTNRVYGPDGDANRKISPARIAFATAVTTELGINTPTSP